MIITAGLIRKFPFAVAPHRVTDELQVLISRDMAETARAEGHVKRLPTGGNYQARDRDEDELTRRSEGHIIKAILGGYITAGRIAYRANLQRHVADKIIAAMVARGDLAQGIEKRSRTYHTTYSLANALTPAGKDEAEQIIRAEAMARSA